MPGDIAKSWERSVINFLKDQKAEMGKPSLGIRGRKFSGHTESWIEESFSVDSLQELLNSIQQSEI
jgi:hypothetical protein